MTGANRGIGRACAGAGADVILGVRGSAGAQDLVEMIQRLGPRVATVWLDMAQIDSVRTAAAAALEHFGRIDILVNNVGIAPGNLAENITEANFGSVRFSGGEFGSGAAGGALRIVLQSRPEGCTHR
ncbi:SDR family NAD(P)-dependent oxidoreductase [Lichenifustis flavocetrariae]|uniref:SDR family NAD(P)-dependent oxidoreductase n=1 Tax=Lichenifustis flavocetrariae TaxID=2949735 RepID=UPI003D0F83BC